MKLDPRAGEHISVVADKAVVLIATNYAQSVEFDFNEIEIVVTAGMTAADVVALYNRKSEERHQAYVSTPEYGERQRKAEEESRKRSADRAAWLAKSPAMFTLRDAEGWAKAVAANTDGYGGAVIKFASAWAQIMEGMIALGASVAGCANEACRLADDEGITGHMYGCAVGVLSAVWAHGEELRRWHNKDVQIADEGDRANESGGVLNPALLTIN